MQSEQTQLTSLAAKNYSISTILGYLALIAAHCLLLLVASLGAPLISAIILAALWAILIASKLLIKPARIIYIFIFLLPIYQWTLVLLLQFSQSTTLLAIVQPWKEILVFGALFLIIGYHILIVQRIKIRLHLMDVLMLAYLGLNLLYLIAPFETTFITRLYGFRSLTLMIFIYFLGRLVPLSLIRQRQVLKSLIILAIATGIFTLLERFIFPIDWPVLIGFPQFLSRSVAEDTNVYYGPMNLPWTFWTSTNLRRSSSFFANPLDLAASIHILGVTSFIVLLCTKRRTKFHMMAKIAFGMSLIALLFSISRASIVAFAIECLLIAFFLRRHKILLMMTLLCIIAIVGALLSPVGGYIIETVTLQNPSVIGHLHEWESGYIAIFEKPWGLGPGTSGSTGARSGFQVGGESAYIITGVQLGVLGILAYTVIQLVAIRSALRLFKLSIGVTQMLALIAAVSRIGLLLIGLTANHEIYLFTTFLSWWLMGWVIQSTPRTEQIPIQRTLTTSGQQILQS